MENKKYHLVPEDWLREKCQRAYNDYIFLSDKYMALKEIKDSFPAEEINKSENLDRLKELAHNGLPDECVMDCGEIKFCNYRQGDGNYCKQCSNLKPTHI